MLSTTLKRTAASAGICAVISGLLGLGTSASVFNRVFSALADSRHE